MQAYYIVPVPSGPGGPVDPGYGVHPPTWGGGGQPGPFPGGGPVDPGYGVRPPTWGGGGQPGPFPPQGGGGTPPGFWGGGPHPMPPIQYPPQGGGGTPPGFWGPPGPWVTPPIANVPGAPGYDPGRPPHIWGGANEPFPTPPIVIPDPVPPDYHPEHPIVLPPGAPAYPQNPAVMPAGTIMPHADIPGTGTSWLLGYFGGELGYRWVAVDAGGPGPKPPTPPSGDKPQVNPLRK